MVDKLSPTLEPLTISHGEIKVIFNTNGSVEVHEKGKLTFHAVPDRALALNRTPQPKYDPNDWYADLVRSRVKENIDTWPENWQKAMTPENETYVAIMRIHGHTTDPLQEPSPVDSSGPKQDAF